MLKRRSFFSSKLSRAHTKFGRCATENKHEDWKRNAGTDVSVDRHSVHVGWGTPPRIETNVRVGRLVISGTTLYLFPDRLLIYGQSGIQSVVYSDLTLEPGAVLFVEQGIVPSDAVVVDTTWRYINRDGGPDRRFKDNRPLPVVRYGILNISAHSGLRLRLHLSKEGLADGAYKLLGLVQAAIKELHASGSTLKPKPTVEFSDSNLPPLAVPAQKVARLGVAALEYRWLGLLPDWAVPIVWGLVFALPAVALINLFARGINPINGVFLGITLFVSGCGIPVLIRDQRRLMDMRKSAEETERISNFRAVLISEIRARAPHFAGFDFDALVVENGLTPKQAGTIAEELYRRMADRVVNDGVITPKEKHMLRVLAETLRVSPDRVSEFLVDAKFAAIAKLWTKSWSMEL